MIRQAPYGWGVVAPRPIALILDAIGIRDAVCKVWGSTNEGNVVRATFVALSKVRSLDEQCQLLGVDRRRFNHDMASHSDFKDRLYRGGNFNFEELTGRRSKYAMLATPDLEDESFEVSALDGSDMPSEARASNPKFEEWDRIAEANMIQFIHENEHLIRRQRSRGSDTERNSSEDTKESQESDESEAKP